MISNPLPLHFLTRQRSVAPSESICLFVPLSSDNRYFDGDGDNLISLDEFIHFVKPSDGSDRRKQWEEEDGA